MIAAGCKRCGETALRRPARICGFCLEELDRRALVALTKPSPERSFAVFHLRDRGYSPEQVREVKRRLADGEDVDAVCRWLWADDSEAVAA